MLNFKIRGEGNPIVFIHGYLESSKMWENYADELAKEYKVVTIDLPGHGASGVYSDVHTMELVAEKIDEVLEKLKISEVLAIGHSMGGYVTLALADLYPSRVKAFVLMNSSSLADTEEKKEIRLRAVELADKNMPTLVKMSIPLLFNESKLNELKVEREFAKEMALSTDIEGVKAALKGMRLRKDRTHILNEFNGEIGIILGEFDRTVIPGPFKKVIPNRKNIEILELETGHMAYLEATEDTLDYIRKFAKKALD